MDDIKSKLNSQMRYFFESRYKNRTIDSKSRYKHLEISYIIHILKRYLSSILEMPEIRMD